MRTFLRFLTGFMVGSLFGTSLALLLAPSSGEELRLNIQEEAQRIKGEVKKASEEKRKEMEGQLASLRKPRKPEQL